MTIDGIKVDVWNVQDGYCEIGTPHGAGYVERYDVRVSLDLETGRERTVRRWFPFQGGGLSAGPVNHWESGYATRKEAIKVLVMDIEFKEW